MFWWYVNTLMLGNNSIFTQRVIVLIGLVLIGLNLFLISKLRFSKNVIKDLEVRQATIEDSLSRIDQHLNDYTLYLKAVNKLLENNTAGAIELFDSLAYTNDSLIVKALYIKSLIYKNEKTTVSTKKSEIKGDEIAELSRLLAEQSWVDSKFNQTGPDPAVIHEKSSSSNADKDNTPEILIFKSSKGVKIEYSGQISGGKANGYGVGLFESGGIYKGYWHNNLRHGKGTYTWNDGEKYEGEFVNDKREGIGTYIWKNGEKYEGQWKNDMRDGKGTMYKPNGEIKISGLFVKDVLQ